MTDAAWTSRKTERLRVTLHARCIAPGADGSERDNGVTLVNITPEGCCMTTGGTALSVNTAVLVRLESGESLTGWVRWFDGEKAGVEFDQLLAADRVEYLRREHSTFLSEVDWSQRRVQRSVC